MGALGCKGVGCFQLGGEGGYWASPVAADELKGRGGDGGQSGVDASLIAALAKPALVAKVQARAFAKLQEAYKTTWSHSIAVEEAMAHTSHRLAALRSRSSLSAGHCVRRVSRGRSTSWYEL